MKRTLFILCICLFVAKAFTQNKPEFIDTSFVQIKIDYTDYLALVGKNNLNYAAQKFNINIANAQIETAKIFPDPQIIFGYFDNGQRRMNMGYGFNSGLNWTLELGGKRKARINLANSQAELAHYLLQDYFRNLRADATLGFLAAMKDNLLLDILSNSYLQMSKLAQSDSIRFKLASITQVDARQSKLEAGMMLNNVYQADAQFKNSLISLWLLLGVKQTDTLFLPQGDFSKFERNFILSDLVITAQNNRADLSVALQNKNISQHILQLAKANRIIDLGIATGITYSSYDRNIIAPTPSYAQVGIGISVPLKFSNNHPGELKTAYYSSLQAETQYRQIELQIQDEVVQAYFNYLSMQKQVQQFNTGLLTEAQAVLDGKIYSYKRGETSLLEVLNAQRTFNEVQQDYYQTLYSYAAALVELERAAGIWDINF